MSEVRRVGLDALASILALDRACFTRAWSTDAWAEELSRGAVFVTGEPPVGFACAAMIAGVCELRRIAVEPTARRRGVARDLLRAVIDHARAHACERVQLEVAAANVAAIALYRAHGFVLVGRRRNYYREPVDDALLMDRPLGANDV